MSILIKGMEMPQCCGECKFMVDRWCYASEDCYYSPDRRHPDCPLVEVPTPHGRLIDADELREKMIKEADTYIPYVQERERRGYHNCELLVDDAPTVIESEEL